MKKQYIVIYEYSYDKLEERVAVAMEEGYKPHGSLVFRPEVYPSIHHTKAAFIQPMILKS